VKEVFHAAGYVQEDIYKDRHQIPRPGSGADGKTGRGTGDSGGNVEKVQ